MARRKVVDRLRPLGRADRALDPRDRGPVGGGRGRLQGVHADLRPLISARHRRRVPGRHARGEGGRRPGAGACRERLAAAGRAGADAGRRAGATRSPTTRRARRSSRRRPCTARSTWPPTPACGSRSCTSPARSAPSWCATRSARGRPVTMEICPHHLLLDLDDLVRLGPYGVCAPALRDRALVERLWDYVLDGTADCLVSDHCAYTLRGEGAGLGEHLRRPAGLPGDPGDGAAGAGRGVPPARHGAGRVRALLVDQRGPDRAACTRARARCCRAPTPTSRSTTSTREWTVDARSQQFSKNPWSPFDGRRVRARRGAHAGARRDGVRRRRDPGRARLSGRFLSCQDDYSLGAARASRRRADVFRLALINPNTDDHHTEAMGGVARAALPDGLRGDRGQPAARPDVDRERGRRGGGGGRGGRAGAVAARPRRLPDRLLRRPRPGRRPRADRRRRWSASARPPTPRRRWWPSGSASSPRCRGHPGAGGGGRARGLLPRLRRHPAAEHPGGRAGQPPPRHHRGDRGRRPAAGRRARRRRADPGLRRHGRRRARGRAARWACRSATASAFGAGLAHALWSCGLRTSKAGAYAAPEPIPYIGMQGCTRARGDVPRVRRPGGDALGAAGRPGLRPRRGGHAGAGLRPQPQRPRLAGRHLALAVHHAVGAGRRVRRHRGGGRDATSRASPWATRSPPSSSTPAARCPACGRWRPDLCERFVVFGTDRWGGYARAGAGAGAGGDPAALGRPTSSPPRPRSASSRPPGRWW